jgi:pilus assembly protein CpaB
MAGSGSPRALRPRALDRLTEALRGPGWRRVALARRVAAAVLASTALVLALAPASSGGGVPVVLAARDLGSGSTVTAADLRLATWPADLVPAGALSAAEAAEGRVLAGAARAGEPVTDVRLAGPELAARLTGWPDSAAVPLRLADPDVAALLRPGRRVDVVVAGPEAGGVVLAADVAVLAVLVSGDRPAGAGPLVLVAMPRALATRVAAASLADQVAVTLR